MAKSVTQNDREDLKSSGLWSEFVSRRDDLKRQGSTPRDARAAAMNAVGSRLELWRSTKGREGTAQAQPTGSNSRGSSKASNVVQADSPRKAQGSKSLPLPASEPSLEFEYSVLIGKSCSVVEAVQWVAQNLENPSVGPTDAPSAEAYGMLMNYREPHRKSEFWDKVYVKLIPSRAQLDDGESRKKADGQQVLDAIEQLIEIREKLNVKA